MRSGDLSRLKISYDNPKLKITKTGEPVDLIYYSDARGEVNESLLRFGLVNAAQIRSITQRVAGKFVITSYQAANESGRLVITDVADTLEVLPDGKTLSLLSKFVLEGKVRQWRKLFERAEGPDSSDINGKWREKLDHPIVTLIIEHRDPEIKVWTRELWHGNEDIQDSVYYSDGRGETNREGVKPIKSVTKWKGNSLTIVNRERSTDGRSVGVDRSVQWQLSKDGKSLSKAIRFTINVDGSGNMFSHLPKTEIVFARSSSQLPGP